MTDKTDGPQVVEIRKYPNRRYYDPAQSRHLTLEDIRQLVRKGADVRILDSQTGLDITSKVLTQIILEYDAPKLDLLTVPLLTQMIRVNDQVMKGFFEKFFHQALNSFFTFQRQLDKQLREGQVLPSLFPVFAPWYKGSANSSSAPEPPDAGSSGAAHADLAQTVQAMQEELRSLRSELKAPPKRRKRRPK